MPIITLAETKDFLAIASTETEFDTLINNLLPDVADRVREICNNAFTIQRLGPEMNPFYFSGRNRGHGGYGLNYRGDDTLYILRQVDATFSAASALITARGENFASTLVAAGQDIFIKDSYRNDGYYQVDSVSTSTLTIASTLSAAFVDEGTGASVFIAVVDWPNSIKNNVASLIQFDYQERGTWKESEAGGFGIYGYPNNMLRDFQWWTKPRYGSRVS